MEKRIYNKLIDDLRYNLDKTESNINILVNAKDYTIDKLGLENINLQRENKELKAKVAYFELNKEGIEQKDDILFKQNAYLSKQILNYKYCKNSIDREEKKDLMQEIKELEQELKISNKERKQLRTELTRSNRKNEDLKQENDKLKEAIEKLDGKLILKDNLLSEQKQENEKLKNKLYDIKGIIHVQHTRTYTNDNLMITIKLIEDNLKES